MPMLAVNKVNVFHGDLQALWDIKFEVDEGEIVTIVGSNGAGKTTILNTISGLLKPKSGSIYFLGQQIDKLPAHKIVKLGICLVPEGRLLFPHMSVMDNLKLGACACGEKEETLEWVLQLFPRLNERKKQIAGTLSGGEQQMLAIGRGLMSMPKLLMLDEPSLGLAPKLVIKVFEIVNKIGEQGVTILLVEQDVRRALQVANRACVLETGRIIQEGSREELLKSKSIRKAYLGL